VAVTVSVQKLATSLSDLPNIVLCKSSVLEATMYDGFPVLSTLNDNNFKISYSVHILHIVVVI